ncbi:MAG: hypothetical protein GTO55_11570 [Armatimonadetes bacterium]|nr:hypothetical protein [Armatimonadota bacterium]NIM24854.1 hypothetical protein [Armatimonadota bacterium]NIM68744.1 hypothetical protein [Armatimonadota bacterium]NIM76037.1 hypothetical protein [Armatimonadota bacterium]NIN06941.1 hypothetical protein [Armatimonadota bacterium]
MASSETPETYVCDKCKTEIANGQRIEHRGGVYCANCVGDALNGAVSADSSRGHSVVLAVLLSAMPGLGQMYNRQMKKGLLVMAAFLFSAIMLDEMVRVSIAIVIVPLYFWNLFDAYWTACRITLAGEAEKELPPEKDWEWAAAENHWEATSKPGFGILLIVLGIIFLINNFGVTWLTYALLWPAAILALGIWLLVSFAMSRSIPAASESLSQETRNGEEDSETASP